MSRSEGLTKCPRCGGKNLQVENPGGSGMLVVVCMDCEAEFKQHRRQEKRRREKRRPEDAFDDYR